MKKIYFAFITLSLLFIATSCDKDLPYPIDEVKIGLDTEVRVNFWKIENVTHTLGENNKIQ